MASSLGFRRSVGGLVCAAVLALSAGCFFGGPRDHEAVARVQVQKAEEMEKACLSMLIPSEESGPYWIQTEFEAIQSKVVLIPVITNLDLTSRWSAKGKANTPGELYPVLKRRLRIKQARSTSLIEIHARSKDPTEAAELANAIASTFCKNRFETRLAARSSAIAAFEKELQRVEGELADRNHRGESEMAELKARRDQLLKCLNAEREKHVTPPAAIIDLAHINSIAK